MNDKNGQKPDHRCLFGVASDQHGFFTAADARGCGFSSDLLGYHVATSRLLPVGRGIYRLRDFPSDAGGDIAEAWIRTGKVGVVSHESALELLDLGDVIPRSVHFTVPRGLRGRRPFPGITLHTTVIPLAPDEVTERVGLPVTAPLRTILDAAAAGTPPEQIQMVAREAMSRGWVDAGRLAERAMERGPAIAKVIALALDGVRA